MNENAASLAALNVGLLEAIAQGPTSGPSELAERAGLIPNHIARKLASLLGAGLIEKTGDGSCDVALTEDGQRARAAMAVWRGEAAPIGEAGISYIPLNRLQAWADNPRKHIPPRSIVDMAQSVSDRGIDTPITVRPFGNDFEVLFGQRRFLGSQHAAKEGWITPDTLIPCRVRNLTDAEAEEAAGVENLQREDMHWADLAQYFRHMMDDRRLSGPQLERMFGGKNYSARKIQDYAKIARELPEDVFALAYEPAFLDEAETKPNPKHLTYTKARDLVGDKKEKLALELTPKLKLALLELIYAAVQWVPPKHGETIEAVLHKPPMGGPLGTLASDRKLIEFGFNQRLDGRPVVARIRITPEVHAYLGQIGWMGQPGSTLLDARVAVVGELQAEALDEDEFVTPELNRPKAPTPAIIAPKSEAASELRTSIDPTSAPDAADFDSLTPPLQELLIEIARRILSAHGDLQQPFNLPTNLDRDPTCEAQLRRLEERHFVLLNVHAKHIVTYLDDAGEAFLNRHGLMPSAPQPAAEPATPKPAPPTTTVTPTSRAADAFDLPPMLAIVVVELAHKISASGVERGPGTWAVDIRESYYRDRRAMQLVQEHKALAFIPQGRDRTLATLTKRALSWLEEKYLCFAEDGRPMMGEPALRGHQAGLGFKAEDDGIYATYWLNSASAAAVEPASAAPAEAADPAPHAAANPAAPRRDAFMTQVMEITAESRIRDRLCAALREARAGLHTARTRKLTSQDVAKYDALIDAALEAAEALNPPQASAA